MGTVTHVIKVDEEGKGTLHLLAVDLAYEGEGKRRVSESCGCCKCSPGWEIVKPKQGWL